MIALNGVRLHKLDRDGTVARRLRHAGLRHPPGRRRRRSTARSIPAISPDGTKVAYTYYYMTQSQNPTCFPPTCVVAINEGGTGYSYSDRQTDWDEPGLGYHSGWRHRRGSTTT